MKYEKLIDKLYSTHSLRVREYELLIKNYEGVLEHAQEKAVEQRKKYYSNTVFIRGLIEISNICKNDCLYCGIRRSNINCDRYRLTKEDILNCCKMGYELGFRTFVLQGGEDLHFDDTLLCDIVKSIKQNFSDCAVTLSLGERSQQSYQLLFDAGADRYLLRHETADKKHYCRLHPKEMSFHNRMKCLKALKKIGYQVGCGMMVGSPWQTAKTLAKDLKFIEKFSPDMCGIGPFIPHKATEYASHPHGDINLSCFLLSLVRLIKPNILLPSTTALGTIDPNGREKGILSGANVIMPNLSPNEARGKYELYDNKLYTGCESAQGLLELKEKFKSIGYEITIDRGDIAIEGLPEPASNG